MREIKYNRIGTTYNKTREADSYLTNRLFHLLEGKRNKLYLDIGCGTGNYTVALSKKGLNFYGMDPSRKMLDKAKSRSKKIKWFLGTAEQIPSEDNFFNGAIATLTVHHWTNIKQSLLEISRVLDDKGKIVFFTSTPEQMKGYWLNHYFPEMLHSSIMQMPSLENIRDASINAGLEITSTEKYFIQDDLQDHFLYAGKNKPELYLKGNILSGISSFAALANKEEVNQGLAKLCTDLENGAFNPIKAKYDNNSGDYLFITAKKKSRAR